MLVVLLLLICTCTYIHEKAPPVLDRNKQGFLGLFWKFARIGTTGVEATAKHSLIAPFN